MTMTRRDLAGLAALATAAAVASPARAQSVGRRAEVEALRLKAETTHPRAREAAADADWRERWHRLAADADALSDGAYFHRTRQALGWFKDGHTTVLPFEFVGGVPAAMASGPFGLSLPIGVRVFHDGAYVVSARDEGAALLGAKLARVGAMDVTPLVKAWATDWPGNDAWAHRWAGSLFEPAFLQALGAAGDPAAALTVEGMQGQKAVRATLRPKRGGGALQPLQRTKTQAELWSEEAGSAAGGNFVRQAGEALYISCDDLSPGAEAFGKFTRACFEAMEQTQAKRLVVDLRRNGGGNNFNFEALRRRIARSRFNRPGGLYVMTSTRTFSAAQNAATRLERETFALFVGEPTGGAPNHYGDAGPHQGAASGLTAIVSTLPWFDSYPMDKRDWIMPDLPSPQLFADWRDGRDPALDIAMTHAGDAPADDWSPARMFFYARPSQKTEWRPFWRQA